MNLHDLANFMLIVTRVSALVAFFPLFGRRQVPVSTKAGLSLGLSYYWFSTLPNPVIPETLELSSLSSIVLVILVAKEMGIGLLFAILLGFMMVPAKVAGQYVGQELGLSMAAVADPSSPDSSGEIGQFFETLAILLFFGLNLHHFVLIMLDVSFRELGGRIDLLNMPTAELVGTCSRLDKYGLLIAAPLGICLFLLNLGLVYLNKAAPTMNLFSVGMALRGFVGLLCMFIFLPAIFHAVSFYFGEVQHDIEDVLMVYQEVEPLP